MSKHKIFFLFFFFKIPHIVTDLEPLSVALQLYLNIFTSISHILFSAFTPPFLKYEIHSPWRPSLRALWFRGSESNSMCFITCLSNPGKGKHMSQWNTIEFRLCVDFSPILTRHIQRNKSPSPDSADLICSSSTSSSSESSQCRRLCLPLFFFFFFPAAY